MSNRKMFFGTLFGTLTGVLLGIGLVSVFRENALSKGNISIPKRAKGTDGLVGLWRSSVKGDNHLLYLLPNQECAILGNGTPTACFWSADGKTLSLWIPVEGPGEGQFRYNLDSKRDQAGWPPNRLTFNGDIEPAYLRKEMHRYSGGIVTDWR